MPHCTRLRSAFGAMLVGLLAVPVCAQDRGDKELPERRFDSRLSLVVYAISAQGTLTRLGKTPGSLRIPRGQSWFVRPERLTAAGLAPIAAEIRSRGIPGLSLRGLELVDDRMLAQLAGLDQLAYLDLTGCWRLTDQGLATLSGLTGLRVLRLRGCNQIGNDGLARIRRLTRLRDLDIWGCCPLTGDGLVHLRELKQLSRLTLTSHSTGGGLARLHGLPIRRLDLSNWGWLTNKGLTALRGFKQLTELNLSGCVSLSDPMLAHVGSLTRLRKLNLDDCNITNAGLAQLSGLTEIREIRLPEGVLGDAGLRHIVKMTALTRLSLRRCRGISDGGLALISRRLRALRRLNLSRCINITDAGIAHLSSLRALQEINLRGARNLTRAAIARLQSRLPSTRIQSGGQAPPPGK